MVLAYHRITPGFGSYLYSIARGQFDEHLEVVAGLQAGPPRAGFSPEVTFDDGHGSNYAHGLDLLQKHSVRATFFVIAGWMGSQEGFMTWPELRELVSLGHCVQSHGWSHRILTECSESELEKELRCSRQTIEDRLGTPVEAISAPHGKWNDRVLQACAAAGYRRVYISNPWMRPQRREGVECLGRYMVRRTLPAQQLRRLLTQDPLTVFFLRSQYRLKETVRRVVGDAAYRRLWSAVAAAEEAGEPVPLP